MIRAVQVIVLVFWLVMMFRLVRGTWFPDESRFVEVEPAEVLEAIFVNWDDSARMVILEDGQSIGQFDVSAGRTYSRSSLGGDAAASAADGQVTGYLFSSNGALSDFEGGPQAEKVEGDSAEIRRDKFFWNGQLVLGPDYEMAGGELRLQFPNGGIRIDLAYRHAEKTARVKVEVNRARLFFFDGPVSELQSSAGGGGNMMSQMAMPMLAGSLRQQLHTVLPGVEVDDITGAIPKSMDELKANLSGMGLRIRTSFGTTTVEGQRMGVYLIAIGIDDRDSTVRIYLGEDGRPVKIDTPLSYRAIAEVLAPEHFLDQNAAVQPPRRARR